MTNSQYIINDIRNTLNSMEYINNNDYERINSLLDSLERELDYRNDYEDYANENDINDIDEDLYN